MKVLLLSAYHAASHRYWVEGLQRQFGEIDWTVLTLPPRYFRWRMRGNALSWLFSERERLSADYDLLICTSMVDLAGLRGMLPEIARIPSIVYFHENQFAYPSSEADKFSAVELQMLTLYSALSADALVFNSDFNRQTFLQGCEQLLRKLPDHNPWQAIVTQLHDRSQVLPVPLSQPPDSTEHRDETGSLQLVWNHRWEYDKGPEHLLAGVLRMRERQLPVTLHVVGQRFRHSPAEFAQLPEIIGDDSSVKLGRYGFIEERADYFQLLSRCDAVLSTSLHDFQGLSVLEAVQAGCLPVLPQRLCYPEWFDSQWLYPSEPDDVECEAQGLVAMIEQRCKQKRTGSLPEAPLLSHLEWPVLAASYRKLFQEIAR